MAIARVAHGGDIGDTTASNTVSLDAGSASDRFIIASAIVVNPSSADTTGVTYNGTALTEVATYSPIDLQINVILSTWYLGGDGNVSTGTNNLVATRNGAAGADYHLYGVTYSGVDSTSPSSTDGGIQTGTPITRTVTTGTTGSWVYAATTLQDTFSSWGGSAVALGSLVFNGQSYFADTNGTVANGSINMTMNWTGTGNGNKAVMIAMDLKPASAGGGTVKRSGNLLLMGAG